ncbi:S-adenosyl-L-methionine-dependent methyltransferase [Xylaria arbuscula]|nr:S-adenosyl-L-methionine-dependent methyltransferase [Xylaria arbuscula]
MSQGDYSLGDNIIVIEEDDCDSVEISPLERGLHNLQHARRNGQSVPFIDLTQDEEEKRDVLLYESQIVEELERQGRNTSNYHRRQPAPPRSTINSFRHYGMLIQKGTVVEVPPKPEDQYCWQFLRVSEIYRDSGSRNITLRGIRFMRNRNLRGMLPRLKNEVCALYDINKDDKRPEEVQAAVEIAVSEVIRTRAIFATNAAFPKYRFKRGQWESTEQVDNRANLVQRWKYYCYWPTRNAMINKRSYGGAIVRLRASDVKDEHFRAIDEKLRNEFRGGIIRGGSFKDFRVSIPTVDLDTVKDNRRGVKILERNQRYTADDMFCGARGASRGIQQAGLQLNVACDLDETACRTYRGNFPRALLNQMNIFNFIELNTSTPFSDFLHISPPCQVFSPAHTCLGKNDEANVAALYACGEVLQKRRPRICTGEQTFGLLFDRNEEFFNALVGQYTALGYSFSWDILHFVEYGMPSTRRRLIWIASCPGEALPPFPKPTNGKTGKELPAPVTIRSVLANIRQGNRNRDPLHDVENMLSRARMSIMFPKRSYDDRCQIGTITTAGSEWVHPSGKRRFTLRELACLQGFPKEHTFVGTMTQINRQIGNAFPPVVVEILYRHLKKWLLHQDHVVPKHKTLQSPLGVATKRHSRDVIVLDPVNEAVARPSGSKRKFIIIDDDDDDEFHSQRLVVSSREQADDAIAVDESGDTNMVDLTETAENNGSFSRESSRTLSAESLPSLMELDVNEYNVE